MALMKMNAFHHSLLVAALSFGAMLVPARAASGTITASPNPCVIPYGAHDCTSYLAWSTEGAHQARVYVQAQGKRGAPEKEFAKEPTCARCGASWIEAGTQYVFTLVDFSSGGRGGVLATVTVTASEGPGMRTAAVSGVITAAPNPCRIEPGKADCTTYLKWSSTGPHARVYVTAEGRKGAPEKEFGTGRVCERCSASWIEEGTRYLFTLYDFSSGSRGAALNSVVVTAVK